MTFAAGDLASSSSVHGIDDQPRRSSACCFAAPIERYFAPSGFRTPSQKRIDRDAPVRRLKQELNSAFSLHRFAQQAKMLTFESERRVSPKEMASGKRGFIQGTLWIGPASAERYRARR